MGNYWVYILTNKPRGTLYVGVLQMISCAAFSSIAGVLSQASQNATVSNS